MLSIVVTVDCRNMDGPVNMLILKMAVSTTNYITEVEKKNAKNDKKSCVSQSVTTWKSPLIGRQAESETNRAFFTTWTFSMIGITTMSASPDQL